MLNPQYNVDLAILSPPELVNPKPTRNKLEIKRLSTELILFPQKSSEISPL